MLDSPGSGTDRQGVRGLRAARLCPEVDPLGVRAEWVLNHEFLRMEERTLASAPRGERDYGLCVGYRAETRLSAARHARKLSMIMI